MRPCCPQCVGQLEVFVDRYSSSSQPLSIGYSAELTRARIARRRDEVHSLLDASNAHIYAGPRMVAIDATRSLTTMPTC